MHTIQTEGTKTDRISIRLEPDIKQRIEQAAAIDHRSLTSFIIASAAQMAEKVLKRSDEITLSNRDWDIFYNALTHPPKPGKTLKKAFNNYQHLNIQSDV